MKRELMLETAAAVVLTALLILLLDPRMFWMPSEGEMLVLAGVIAAAGAFIGLVWREKPRDEREQSHVLAADRYAYLAGTTVLALGIVVQSLAHDLSPWLPTALVVMIVVRLVSLVGNGVNR